MENSSPKHRKKTSGGENARWACLLIFIVAVGATLLYVSSEKHSTGTLVLLGAVLLVGQICAMLPWIISAKHNSSPDATGTVLSEKIDSCMAKSFANQEIIHNEVHTSAESLAKRIEALESAEKSNELSEPEIAKIAEITAAKILAGTPKIEIPDNSGDIEDAISELASQIKKDQENSDERSEEFDKKIDKLAGERIDKILVTIGDITERLDTLALNQENILEKLEALEILPDDELDDEEEAEENSVELDSENNTSDEAFPLPENMLARAQAANASAGTVVEKMISENLPQPAEPDIAETESVEEPAETVPATPDGELPLVEDLPHTALILKAEFNPGEKPFLRGNAPGLSPKKSVPMEYSGNGRWRFDFGPMKNSAEIMIFRNDTNEALGEPVTIPAGKVTTLAFDPNA